MTIVSIIAAIDDKRGLGKNNKLLWHIPEDLMRFKKITFGHPVIMGRKTFQSIGKPLPNRTNIIVTRNKKFHAKGCLICHLLKDAIVLAKKKDRKEIFIIGGGVIYRQAIGLVDKLYLTVVKGDFGADIFFPDYSSFDKIISNQTPIDKNYAYRFLVLIKSEGTNDSMI